MDDIYYEITDLLGYLSGYGNVTGIQRVATRLLGELARLPGAARSWCVAIDAAGSGYRAWRLTEVFTGSVNDDVGALMRLVDEPRSARWPSRSAVRRHLNRHGARGWHRTAVKAGLYARALVAPGSLHAIGLAPKAEAPPAPAARTLAQLPREATLVLLGAGWCQTVVSLAAGRHARRGGRLVYCIHDLIPLVRPDYFHENLVETFTRYLTEAADQATEFICVSRHTQADLEKFLEGRGKRTPSTVVRLAHEFAGYPRNARGCRPGDARLRAFGDPARPFLLCVGTVEVRKNGVALLDAWEHLRTELGDETPHLVFCGRRGWKVDSFFDRLAGSRRLRERVHIVAGADDADLSYLHEHSVASLYPSLYEGWGLPVGEAAWFGRLCITSGESSLPEVCGMLAEYVDPRSAADIGAAVQRATLDHGWRNDREQLIGTARLRTWHDVANDLRMALVGPDRQQLAAGPAPGHIDSLRTGNRLRKCG